ncbi:NAD-dependent epimerase/dehydratase family protein, partial [Arthrospira platensis SPKY1]|nr:NAD-dependent epimerase/dehydratase family protein [Arthrospira platensis SPKY1]
MFQKAQQGTPISLFGTGEESRDFIYIQDLVRAIYLAAMKAPCQGEAINLANGIEVPIKDAVAAFYACFDQEIDYAFSGSSRPGDPKNWVADISTLASW